MQINFQNSYIQLLKIAIAFVAFVDGRETYVVQTSDNMLHFITDKRESHSLNSIFSPMDCSASITPGEHTGVQKYIGGSMCSEYMEGDASLVLRANKNVFKHSTGAPDSFVNSQQDGTVGNKNNTLGATKHEEQSVRKVSRIDGLSIEKGGFILINNKKIYIEDLLVYPVIESGIYLSAAQDHIPRLINNTVVIVANFKVYILDLYDYSSKTIKFNQILYLYDTFRHLNITGDRIFLNERFWDFGSKIVAVFVLREKDGFTFMLRVMNDTGISIYRPRAKKSYKIYILVIFPFVLAMFYSRNVKYGKCISRREKVYLGTFIKKECLIYQVSSQLLQNSRKNHTFTKHSNLVNVLYDGVRLFQPVIVTEKTFQLDPRRKASHVVGNDGEEDILDSSGHRMRRSIQTIVETVEFLHSKGVIHSRICPENLRVTEHDHIRVQSIFDNVGWRSIKQLRSIKSREHEKSVLDDIFSLGCVIHYYLTGYHPFDLRDFVKVQRRSSKVPLSGKQDASGWHSPQNEANRLHGQGGCSVPLHPKAAVREDPDISAHAQASVVLEDGTLDTNDNGSPNAVSDCRNACGVISMPNRSGKYCKARAAFATLHSLGGHLFKLLEVVRNSLVKKRESLHPYFKKVLSDESAANIEYNILFSIYKIRIEDQIEHDFVYHCLKAHTNQAAFSLSSHPYFWEFSKITDFICDSSDFVETHPYLKQRLERSKRVIFEGAWINYLDPLVSINVMNKRLYDYQSLCDLIRFVRNCQRHYQELRNKDFFEKLEGKTGQYFTNTFPELFMLLYRSPIFRDQDTFEKYYR